MSAALASHDLAREALDRHAAGLREQGRRSSMKAAYYRYRRDGEYHAWNPEIIKALHRARDRGTYEDYKAVLESGA